MAICLVVPYASRRGTSSLKRVGLHRLEAGEVIRIVRVPHGEIIRGGNGVWRPAGVVSAPRRHLVVRLSFDLRDSFGQAEKARGRKAAQCGQRRRVPRQKRRWTHASWRQKTFRVLGVDVQVCNYEDHPASRRDESDITAVALAVLHHTSWRRPSAMVPQLRGEEEVALKGRCVPAAAGPHPDVVDGGELVRGGGHGSARTPDPELCV